MNYMLAIWLVCAIICPSVGIGPADNSHKTKKEIVMTATTATTATTTQKRRGRPVDPNSGLAKARALFATLPATSTRQEVIAQFQTLGLSKDTSAAYYSVINRKS